MTAGGVRVVHLEDDDADAELVEAALRADGLEVALTRAKDRAQFEAAVGRSAPDLVLSDFSVPGYDGLSALEFTKEAAPGVPFVYVSGTIGETAAVEAVRRGATDYILKGALGRLGSSARRALSEAADRRGRAAAEEKLRAAEARLQHSMRLEAVGRLAGGVAHDFNNLLTVILGCADMALQTPPPPGTLRDDLAEIRLAAERAAGLTRQLLAFSRGQALAPQPVDLAGLAAGLQGFLRRLLGEEIRLELAADKGLPPIQADPGQLEQVILNLCVNARDAMERGGALRLELRSCLVETELAGHPDAVPAGTYVLLRVTDEGCGMAPEVLAHAFEPFFSTKESGRGTGLGLSTVYGIVRQSGGFVDLKSSPGGGCVFSAYFAPTAAGPAPKAFPPSPKGRGGHERIILAEDDPAVRAFAARVLRAAGYAVTVAANGAEALAALSSAGAFDLLLADIVLPDLSGVRLAASARSSDPRIAVLLTSGYAGDRLTAEGGLPPHSLLLQKPLRPSALIDAVRDLLDAR